MTHILDVFGVLEDPRAANARHDLLDILFIALAATLCGAKNCAEMALFGRTREADLCGILDLKHGVPSHDTFSKVFRHLNPEVFEQVFAEFMAVFGRAMQAQGVVAIDGKQLRRAYGKGRSYAPQMMVTAWGTGMRMVLACRAAPDGGEVAATLELLRLVDLKGSLVTTDALHCRRDTAAALLEKGADYVLALKGNQPTLHRAAQKLLEAAPVPDCAEMRERNHGRVERRRAIVRTAPELATMLDFPGLAAVGQITGTRTLQGKRQTQTRLFLLSRPLAPAELLRTVRAHWDIENGQHWALDVVLDEDLARTRKDHGARNLAVLRRLALNILRAHPDKGSLSGKSKRAGWDNRFLLSLFAHMR